MIFYLTVNEYYSGIYQGQVIDVVSYLRDKQKLQIRLVAFIPLKRFKKERRLIKKYLPDAIVLPSAPKQSIGNNWRYNKFLLFLICKLYSCQGIIARNPISTNLALLARNSGFVRKVCYDGRGAVAAESKEYNIYTPEVSRNIEKLEKNAILLSDVRISITKNLLQYWKERYGFQKDSYFIIPGTLNKSFIEIELCENEINRLRKSLGYDENDIVLIYAGSTGIWQSFNFLYDFVANQLRMYSSIKLLFLSNVDETIQKLQNEFPQRINRMFVMPDKVNSIMMIGDYGLIIREFSVTNKVSLPTKFPEYLACGLNVLVNSAVEEVSRFVYANQCGVVIDSVNNIQLKRTDFNSRIRNRNLALSNYSKTGDYLNNQYSFLVKHMNNISSNL